MDAQTTEAAIDRSLLDAATLADSAGTPESVAAQPGGAPIAAHGELRALFVKFGRMYVKHKPELSTFWTDEALGDFGQQLGVVLAHYGFSDLAAVKAHPLAGLAIAGIPLALPFVLPILNKATEQGAATSSTPLSGAAPPVAAAAAAGAGFDAMPRAVD